MGEKEQLEARIKELEADIERHTRDAQDSLERVRHAEQLEVVSRLLAGSGCTDPGLVLKTTTGALQFTQDEDEGLKITYLGEQLEDTEALVDALRERLPQFWPDQTLLRRRGATQAMSPTDELIYRIRKLR